MSFALDHDYCKVMPFEEDFHGDFPPKPVDEDEAKMAPEKELPIDEEIDVCGEPAYSDEISTSLSPAHSLDSGVDAGMEDFLADFPSTWKDELEDFSLNDEDLLDLEALLRENIPAMEPPAGKETINASYGTLSVLNPTTKANVQTALPKGKKVLPSEEEQAIIEKNKKNAIAARENRQKKKKYVEGLENDVKKLQEDNRTLKTRNERMTTMIRKLSDEVKYLRSVLANESTISLLIKSVAATPGISLTSSLMQSSQSEEEGTASKTCEGKKYSTRSRKRHASEVVEVTPSKRTRNSTNPGGVCLHVSHGKVSLEFCAKCQMIASKSGVQ